MVAMSICQLAAVASVAAAATVSPLGRDAAIWTIVHPKFRPSVLNAMKADPTNQTAGAAGGDQTLHEKIMDYGRELCQGRNAGHPSCKQFMAAKDWEADLLTDDKGNLSNTASEADITNSRSPPSSAKTGTKAAKAPAKEKAAPAPAPAPAKTEAPAAQPLEAAKGKALPEQGFVGPPVQHVHGETYSDDWRQEYPHAGMENGTRHSAAHRRSTTSGIAILAAAWLLCPSVTRVLFQ